MTDANGTPICRVCKKYGVLERGAHQECKNLEQRQRRKGILSGAIKDDPDHRQPHRPPKPQPHQKFRVEFSKPKKPPLAEVVAVLKPQAVNVENSDVKRVENQFQRATLRNLFGDSEGNCWNAVD